MANKEYSVDLLPHQSKFFRAIFDDHVKETAFVGGIGSGKTFAGAFMAMMLSNEYDCPGLICANTYPQLRDSTLRQAKDCWESMGVDVEFNENKKYVSLDGREHFFRSLENYSDIRGMEIGWIWNDEGAFSSLDAYNTILGRLRHPNGPRLAFVTTTGNGRNWIYTHWVEDLLINPKLAGQRVLISDVSSKDNTHLPADYLAMITNSFSGQYALQEIGGQLVSMTGGVFKSMRDELVVPFKFDPKAHPFDISIDYGRRRPAVLFFTEPEKDMDMLFDAILPEDILIDDLIAKIKARGYGDPMMITCDPAGDSGNTHTYETDISKVRDAFPNSSLRYSRDPALTRIEVGISLLDNRLDRGLLLFADSLKHRRPGDYASVVSAFYELHYPMAKDGKAISNQPKKDGKNDHPIDAARYYMIHKHPFNRSMVFIPEEFRRGK